MLKQKEERRMYYVRSYVHIIIVLLALLTTLPVKSQFNMLFTSDYDLPNSLVNKIAEDSYGMLWVATEDGLCRFNGSRFITYRNVPGDENSLLSNFVRTVCTDKRGHTIVGGIGGMQVYNRRDDNFSKVYNTESIGLPTRNINDICLLRNGDFAVMGINTYNVHIDDDGKVTLHRNVLTPVITDGHSVMEDAQGNLWATCAQHGVWVGDPKGHVSNIKAADGRQYDFSMLICGNDSKVYAGHIEGGLYCYNPKTRHFDFLQGTESLVKIRDIKAIPHTNILCVATDGNGVRLYDVKKHAFVTSRMFDDPFFDITQQKVHTLYVSDSGDVWIGLYQKGIFLATGGLTTFGYIGARSQMTNIIGDRCVTSILQRRDGSIWVTTDNGGLYGITPSLQPIRSIAYNEPNGLPASILGLYEDSKGRLWIGSYNRGCGIVDVNTGACHYASLLGVRGTLYSVYGFVEDKRGQIWAASMGNGVLRYDEGMNQFLSWTMDNGTTWTGSIYYDKDKDIIYCGTYDGVVWFSPTDKSRKTHVVGTNAVVYSIARLSKNTLGFGTTNGLVIVDTNTGKYRQLTLKDGLPNSNIFALQASADGHVWMSSGSGLICYDLHHGTMATYSVKDGLQGNEFYKNASLKSRDGKLWFGGINGITVFNPKEANGSKKVNYISRVVSIHAGERDINFEDDGGFTIPAGINAINVELATLPLHMTHRVTYFYSLDGADWMMLPVPMNHILFNNISCGSHTLRTKTVVDGIESEVAETKIYVPYPWFLRWWAMLIWLAIIAAAIYYIYMFLQRRRDMSKALAEHKREEELKETKLQFFMNVVHDLRTPLTLVVTPLQKLKAMDDDGQHQRLYDIMKRNTDRMLSLTNEIMDLRKLDRGKMQLVPRTTFISKDIHNITDAMCDMLATRQQQLTLTDHTDGQQTMMLDPEAFEKILSNLLTNAIKYTPEGGEIDVEWNILESGVRSEELGVRSEELGVRSEELGVRSEMLGDGREESEVDKPGKLLTPHSSLLILHVTDNGIGIPDEEKQHIFERFYQVRANGKHVKGTGIGLNLVRSLVELHHGEITVSNNPAGKGTRFTVLLPNQLASNDAPQDADVASAITTVPQSVDSKPSKENTSINQTVTTQHPTQSPHHGVSGTLPMGEGREAGRFGMSGERGFNYPSSSTSTSKKTILIVDDDDDIRTFLSEEMAASYNVLEAADGQKALDVLHDKTVDIIVSDVMMPEIDGIELTRKVREDDSLAHLPVILLTAKSSDQDRLEGLQATADAYVTKPFNLDLLQTMIVNLLVRNDMLQNTPKASQAPADRIETPKMESADDKLMERVLKVINENLSNPDLTTDLLAQEAGLSRAHLYRKLKELTNLSATNFIRNIRLTKAAELLRQKKGTVSEVAYLVGFRTPAHFSTAFKELYGMTPREYMNRG